MSKSQHPRQFRHMSSPTFDGQDTRTVWAITTPQPFVVLLHGNTKARSYEHFIFEQATGFVRLMC